ncbi:MAG TPA: methyltransferase domain-containing protein, partial [Bacteroidia bacterium]|nr:methyltransferase domain-containing protein [Bacteroidia bacterium]
MRKRLTNILICPNNYQSDLKIYGTKVHRNGAVLYNLDDTQLLEDDDIEEGIIVSDSSQTAYPVSEFIAILLSDTDIDTNHHQMLLEKAVDKCPDFYNTILKSTLERITKHKDTSEGKWNREEMKYYDNEVNTPEQREQMLHSIKNMPIWRIFQPRTKYIIKYLKEKCAGQTILEIGSGNSRTVSWAFNPASFNFKYVGSDISFKRLMVAKKSIPEGDFFQASALNLPFKNDSFYAVIS